MATVQDLVDRLAKEDSRYWPRNNEARTAVEDPARKSRKPTKKVTAAGLAGAIVTVAVFAAGFYKIEVDEVTAAAATLLLSTLAGYIIKD